MDWENHLEKIRSKKLKQKKSEIAACEQKITSQKKNLCFLTLLQNSSEKFSRRKTIRFLAPLRVST